MDLTAEGITKIQQLVEGNELYETIDGQAYTRFALKPVFNDPRPSSLSLSTLDGISDYIKNNLDEIDQDNCMIVIDSYDQISIYSPVMGEKNDRHLITRATLSDVDNFDFGRFQEQEKFIISFSALFCDTPDKEKILSAVSTMQVLDQTSGEDDGATTKRSASNAVICGLDEKDMPKTVVTLKPYRTFREIEQPESAFIFRFKGVGGVPVVALYEADGGAWKLDAKAKIKAYLSEKTQAPIIA